MDVDDGFLWSWKSCRNEIFAELVMVMSRRVFGSIH